MSTNNLKHASMSAQMFYDVDHFCKSLDCDRGPKLREANFVYESGNLLHIKYDKDKKALVIEIFE